MNVVNGECASSNTSIRLGISIRGILASSNVLSLMANLQFDFLYVKIAAKDKSLLQVLALRTEQSLALHSQSTCRCRASNTLIIRYEHNSGTEFEPLFKTVVFASANR